MKRSHRAYDGVKRVLDIAVASTLLVLLSPVLLVTAMLVRFKLGSPVLFRQRRPGKAGKEFTLYKFRTMAPASDAVGDAEAVASDSERLSQFGRTLRATSLDELPELWNVVLGQMSLVGPRPLLVEYMERYDSVQARRHEVRPGITGWAQVNGRNAVDWGERFAMDVWYVDNRSFGLDVRILLMTVGVVARPSGVSAEGSATTQPFDPHAPEDQEKEHS